MSTALSGILLTLATATSLAALTLWQRRRRRAAVSALGDAVLRHEPEVGVRVSLYRATAIHGMDPSRSHVTTGELAASADRMILATDRGVLLDIGRDHGRRLSAVRCPGPGRLVLEGEAPSRSETPGLFRFELTLDDAAAWVELLAPFTQEDAEVSVHPAARRPGTAPRAS